MSAYRSISRKIYVTKTVGKFNHGLTYVNFKQPIFYRTIIRSVLQITEFVGFWFFYLDCNSQKHIQEGSYTIESFVRQLLLEPGISEGVGGLVGLSIKRTSRKFKSILEDEELCSAMSCQTHHTADIKWVKCEAPKCGQEDGFVAAQNFPKITLLSKLNQLIAGGQAPTIPSFFPSLPAHEILSP